MLNTYYFILDTLFLSFVSSLERVLSKLEERSLSSNLGSVSSPFTFLRHFKV